MLTPMPASRNQHCTARTRWPGCLGCGPSRTIQPCTPHTPSSQPLHSDQQRRRHRAGLSPMAPACADTAPPGKSSRPWSQCWHTGLRDSACMRCCTSPLSGWSGMWRLGTSSMSPSWTWRTGRRRRRCMRCPTCWRCCLSGMCRHCKPCRRRRRQSRSVRPGTHSMPSTPHRSTPCADTVRQGTSCRRWSRCPSTAQQRSVCTPSIHMPSRSSPRRTSSRPA